MRAIDHALVDEVWREIIAYPPDRVEAEARAFLERQPHVAAFARAFTQEFDDAVQSAAVGLAVLLFKIVEASREGPLPSLSEERLRRAYRATVEGHPGERILDPVRFPAIGAGDARSGLARHIMAVFYGRDPGGYDEGVKANLLLLLKTLTEALDLGEAGA